MVISSRGVTRSNPDANTLQVFYQALVKWQVLSNLRRLARMAAADRKRAGS
jgi:hypothetical protein